jgi:hypothetical protein
MADKAATPRREIEARIIARAWADETFLQELRRNPKAAIEREVGTLPDKIQIQLVEESPTNFYLVLPAKPSSTGSLSDEELDSVAGGFSTNTWDDGFCY